jgi:hypothetical protein
MENEKQETQIIAEEKKVNPEAIVEEPEVDYVAEAKKAALEMKTGLEERKKILEREEKLVARQEALRQLGGGSMAGQKPKEPENMSPVEYRKQIESGVIPEKPKKLS